MSARRSFILSLVAATLAGAAGAFTLEGAPSAPAPYGYASVLGRYHLEGIHARLGFFAGSFEITQGPSGLRYERSVRFEVDQPPLVERGTVAVGAGVLSTESDPTVPALGGPPRVRRATYRSTATPGRWDGAFVVDGGAADDRGTERLEQGVALDSFELLVDGREFFPRITADIAAARRSIHIELFSWKDDVTGTRMSRLIQARARAGVEVRIIIDGALWKRGEHALDDLRAAGCEVVLANKLGLKTAWNNFKELGRSLLSLVGIDSGPHEKNGLLNRDHRKVIVVDGLVAHTGGMGFADHYMNEWHDLMARLEGPIVWQLQDEFLDRWRVYGGSAPPHRASLYHDRAGLPPAGDIRLEIVASVPGLSQGGKQAYLREIGRARKKILIENPYFLDDDVIHALEGRARGGLPVLVIVPNDQSQDEFIVQQALSFIQNDIVASGVDLRKYRDRMVHGKVAAIDTTWSTIGSTNLDNVALAKNSELNVAAYDPRLARLFERRVFAVDAPLSDRVVPKTPTLWKKVKTGFYYMLRSFL